MAKHALKPVRSTHSRLKLAVPMIVAGSLLSSAAAAYATPGPLQAPAPAPAAAPAATSFVPAAAVTVAPEISAPETAQLSFERPTVVSTAAPKPAPAPAAPAASQEKPAANDATAAQAAAPAAPDTTVNDVAAAAVGAANPANIPGAAGSSASVNIGTAGTGATDAFGQKIVAAALADAKANVQQDCTMLVTRALSSVGISFHDWPAGYLSLGSTTTNPQPGDLIYYKNGGGAEGLAHIAVFIGNGLAVHGGFDGHNTKIFSVNVGSGPIYIHVKR